MKILTLDIETSGLPPYNSDYKKDFMTYPYVVTLAFKVDDQPVKEFVINQEGRHIPAEATAIHGITNEMAAASPHTLLMVLSELIREGQGAHIILGHNVGFDTSIIKANVLRLMQTLGATPEFFADLEEMLLKEKRIDTMHSTISFCNLPGKNGRPKWPKLTELYDKLFPGQVFDAHTSGADVDATYKCFHRLVELGVITMPALPAPKPEEVNVPMSTTAL